MVNVKAALKLISVMILSFGAVFICSIMFNYSFDLKTIAPLIETPQAQAVYDAVMIQNKITIAAAGGMLGAVTLIVLLFSIGRYIADSGAELGMMKALGYSDNRLALDFVKFGLAVLIGTGLGYFGACIIGQSFYSAMDADNALPEKIKFSFNIAVPIATVLLPSLFFSAASVLYAKIILRKKPLDLITHSKKTKVNKLTIRVQSGVGAKSFQKELKRNMLFSNLVLIFFVGFAAFGFAAQVQMAFTMYEATGDSLFMPAVFVLFGLMLGFVTLLLALSFILKKNGKYLAMLKAYGYTDAECNKMLFGGYRVVTYIGFSIGTVYQYFFMKMMLGVFAGAYDIPEVKFPVIGFLITLAAFLAFYELLMLFYKQRITKIPIRQIMQE